MYEYIAYVQEYIDGTDAADNCDYESWYMKGWSDAINYMKINR